ncbi:HTH domain-containing protein [Flavobacterium sp. AJR]
MKSPSNLLQKLKTHVSVVEFAKKLELSESTVRNYWVLSHLSESNIRI